MIYHVPCERAIELLEAWLKWSAAAGLRRSSRFDSGPGGVRTLAEERPSAQLGRGRRCGFTSADALREGTGVAGSSSPA